MSSCLSYKALVSSLLNKSLQACIHGRDHGAKKVSFTACHLGKLLLLCTSPRVFLTSPKCFVISSIDYSSSVISISQKTSLSLLARTEFTSLIAKSTSPRLSLHTGYQIPSRDEWHQVINVMWVSYAVYTSLFLCFF